MRTRKTIAALLAFAAAFVALEVNAYTRKSATWDEPIHLTSGYAALAEHDYRIDPSHPPFVRMWAALPLLFTGRPPIETGIIDRAAVSAWLPQAYGFAHRFLYVENDADRLLYRARFMIVLLGVVLGILLFCWVHEWLGFAPAVIALALFAMEPNMAAHATLVTTDLGLTCFVFGSVYFLWRTSRRMTAMNVAGLAVFVALALVTKFSAVVLLPVLAALLALMVRRRAMTAPAAGGVIAVVAGVAFVAVWLVYGMRYAPSASAGWVFQFQSSAFDRIQILPNAFTQGFFYNQASVQQIAGFLAGEYSADGWWYYFPFAFAIKTPLALLALLAGGAFVLWRRRADAAMRSFILIPIAAFFGVAMASGINIGLRHVLPVYPFVLLIAAAAVAALLERGRSGRLAVAAVVTILAVEFGTTYPNNLTFFNQLVGGPENGFRYLTDSNLGWGQNLKPLKAWMDRNGVEHINLAYFGQADPDYYMIDATYLPGAPEFALERIGRPRLPGYVAISSTVLSGVYLQPTWRLFYRPFLDMEPAALIGNSLRVYWVERWPEATGRYAEGTDVEVHRALADILLFGQQWPTRAQRHYREYLRYRPDDPEALVNAAIASLSINEAQEAITMLERAVAVDPAHGRARLALARALLIGRDVEAAAPHAERAVALHPQDPAAHELLGRVRAIQGEFAEAARLLQRTLELDPEHPEAPALLEKISAARRSTHAIR